MTFCTSESPSIPSWSKNQSEFRRIMLNRFHSIGIYQKRSYKSLSARIFPHSQYCCSITSNLVAKICYCQWKSSNQEEKRKLPVPSSPYSGIRQKYCEFSLCFIWVLTAFSVLTIIHSFSCQTASIFFKPLKPFSFPPSPAKIAAWQCASGRSWIDNDLNILTFILSTLSF